ncbi:hypothetical protein H8E77_15820 [bacterium]|nr:hypothetical protein [bacterium]
MAKRIDGLWRQIATHLGYLKGYEIGGVKVDIDHQGMSISNREFYREHWQKEIEAWIQQIKRANLTFRQLRARLLRSRFTESDIQEVIDALFEIGYDLEDYTK